MGRLLSELLGCVVDVGSAFDAAGYGSASEALALAALGCAPEKSLRVGQLIALSGMSKGAASALLQRLEANGLVTRALSPDDRRHVDVKLTDAGLDRAASAANMVDAFEGALRSAVGKDVFSTLERDLPKLRAVAQNRSRWASQAHGVQGQKGAESDIVNLMIQVAGMKDEQSLGLLGDRRMRHPQIPDGRSYGSAYVMFKDGEAQIRATGTKPGAHADLFARLVPPDEIENKTSSSVPVWRGPTALALVAALASHFGAGKTRKV